MESAVGRYQGGLVSDIKNQRRRVGRPRVGDQCSTALLRADAPDSQTDGVEGDQDIVRINPGGTGHDYRRTKQDARFAIARQRQQVNAVQPEGGSCGLAGRNGGYLAE